VPSPSVLPNYKAYSKYTHPCPTPSKLISMLPSIPITVSTQTVVPRLSACEIVWSLRSLSFDLFFPFLVIRLTVQDAQDGEEQVDDVQIQADGSGNLLLDVMLTQNHLRIDEYIAAEN
jgi:hypothetical protein